MTKTYLERLANTIYYDELEEWRMPDVSTFSYNKSLYPYQKNAIINLAKILYTYFTAADGKEALYNKSLELGMEKGSFKVKEFDTLKDSRKGLRSDRYKLLSNYYRTSDDEENNFISDVNFFNRVAFWMATGSGKSLVITKVIEYLSYLQEKDLIPNYDIMILLPREHLIRQFKREIDDFNRNKTHKIELVNLKNYEEDKFNSSLIKSIKVYYYRSDLIRDERTENILDFKDYENNGNWYVFLDEAHRGETGSSKIQDYISILSRNGFLFNFSATFTDEIDYATTCYNYNLEKFIIEGYGKNIYLSKSSFDFTSKTDDFSEKDKQKQVLKSLITLALVKKTKKSHMYHNPLMVTLVNTINTDQSDLLMFFNKLEEIATGSMDSDLFNETKQELEKEFLYKYYVYGEDKFNFNLKLLEELSERDLLNNIFNSKTNGKIEILEGEKGKELALKLETAESPFALIKIGDTDKFQREKLGTNYSYVKSYSSRHYFDNIDNDNNINILLGSRGFYEGWDSNRPNVINFINIGGSDAKKYVLQALGRGIRIEPEKDLRKRLPIYDNNKNVLLETLFVYASDRKGVETILEVTQEQKNTDEFLVELSKNPNIPFDLLMPIYKNVSGREDISYYSISNKSQTKIREYFNYFDENVLILKTDISRQTYKLLNEKINDGSLFQSDSKKNFSDYNMLFKDLTAHVRVKNKEVAGVKKVVDEIKHFKYIKGINFTENDIKELMDKIDNVKNYKGLDKDTLSEKFSKGEIDIDEVLKLGNSKVKEEFTKTSNDNEGGRNNNEEKMKIRNIPNHYYLPIIYSKHEQIQYIKNIIKVESEVRFLENLIDYLEDNKPKNKWMFSKIVENVDNYYMEYYDKNDNRYRKFYPDYIFWILDGTNYKIIFIDPKGTSYSSYQNKVDEFERMFMDSQGNPNEYEYDNCTVTFELKLVTDDKNKVSGKYSDYWLGEEDFDWLR